MRVAVWPSPVASDAGVLAATSLLQRGPHLIEPFDCWSTRKPLCRKV